MDGQADGLMDDTKLNTQNCIVIVFVLEAIIIIISSRKADRYYQYLWMDGWIDG